MPRVRASAQKRIHFTHLCGKLESIVLRRILQLLVKARDRGAQLRVIRHLCVSRACKEERIERHSSLFGAALPRHGYSIGVAGNIAHQLCRSRLVKRHRRNSLRQIVERASSIRGGCGDLCPIRGHAANLCIHIFKRRIQFCRQSRVHRASHLPKHDISRRIPRRASGFASSIPALLPPTVFCFHQVVMAREAIKLRVFRPCIALRQIL